MPSTYSPDLRIELIATGEQSGTWGSTTNNNLGTLIESAIAGSVSVLITSADQALTASNGAADQARNAVIDLTTSTSANFNVYIPPVSKLYVIKNSSAYAATIYCSTVIGNTTPAGTGVTIPAGKTAMVWTAGINLEEQLNYIAGNLQVGGNVSVTGSISANSASLTTALPVTSGGTGQSTFTDGQLLIGNTSGNTLTKSTLTAGTGVSVTNGGGSITVANTGVTALTAGTGITLSGSTGNVTVSTSGGTGYVLTSYTSPANWTKPVGLQAVKVTVVGAGGNGGAVSTNTVPVSGGGGGGGGAAIYYAPAASIPGPVAITAGASTNSFGGFCSATAGAAGATNTGPGGIDGGTGGVGSGGSLNIPGSPGAPSSPTVGGTSILGPASAWTPQSGPSTPGFAGRGYGGGGSGGFKLGTPNVQTFPGGAGAPGVVIVEEFY